MRTTRSQTKNLLRETHRQSSEIHRAISDRDTKTVESLLSNGEQLCIGKGLNCFILAQSKCPWEIVKSLIEREPQGAKALNENGDSLLMLYAHRAHDVSIIKNLLIFGADINEENSNNQSALFFALKNSRICVEVVKTLLAAGANATQISKYNSESLLHAAVHSCDGLNIELLKLLVEAGVDPTLEDRKRNTVLSYALISYFGSVSNRKIHKPRLEGVRYLFELDHFKNPTFQLRCNRSMHPQYIVLSELLTLANKKAFEFVFKPQFMNVDLSTNGKWNTNSIETGILNKRAQGFTFSVISDALNNGDYSGDVYSCRVTPQVVKNFLEVLLSNGFTLCDPEKVSPLPVFLFNKATELQEDICQPVTFISSKSEVHSHWHDQVLDVTKFMITNGAFVEQNDIEFRDDHKNQLMIDLFLPDALYAALCGGHIQSLRLLLPYFAGPHLSLLLFMQQDHFKMINFLYPILVEGGPVPAGTDVLAQLRSLFETLHGDGTIERAIYNDFINMHSFPMSLRDMCRWSVRMSHADKTQPDNSLPDILASISPPGMRDYLTMKPPEDLSVVFCDDPQVAALANLKIEQFFKKDPLFDTMGYIEEIDEDDIDSDYSDDDSFCG